MLTEVDVVSAAWMTAPPVSLVVVIFANVQEVIDADVAMWIKDVLSVIGDEGAAVMRLSVSDPEVTSKRHPVNP